MIRSPLTDPPASRTILPMPGLEADNLLAFLALLGLLRALEIARPDWRPRTSWQGPPWLAHLHLADEADEAVVAAAAVQGIERIAGDFDVGGRKNVDFDRESFREHLSRLDSRPLSLALAAALTAEAPEKRAGGLPAAPLVMMFGQGWQNFLERLVDVPRGTLPKRLAKLKSPPDLRSPTKIREALFAPWSRGDDSDGFRWDPEEDQRYALRHGDPSRAGAAPTVHGANRLAAIGFLSFACVPSPRTLRACGAGHDADGVSFVWPIWSATLTRSAIEALLGHPDLLQDRPARLRPIGVAQVFRARRISNGKFLNVTRASPVPG